MKKIRIPLFAEYVVAWAVFTLGGLTSQYAESGWADLEMVFWIFMFLGGVGLLFWIFVCKCFETWVAARDRKFIQAARPEDGFISPEHVKEQMRKNFRHANHRKESS